MPGVLLESQVHPRNGRRGDRRPRLSGLAGRARALAENSGHRKAFDVEIGKQLAYAPADEDGWPHREACEYLETGSEALLRNFETGCFNKRGAYWTKEGEADRELADQYALWAEKIELRHPRTGSCLRGLERSLRASSDQERKKDYYGV